jgi:hypothetical protein
MQDNFNIHSWKLKQAINELEQRQCPDCGCKIEGTMCNECGYMEEGAINDIQTPFYFKSKIGIEGMDKDATFQIQDIPNYGNIKVYYYDGILPRFFYMFKDELEKRMNKGDFIKSDKSQFQPNIKEATFTSKHDDNPKLKGGQKDLPDEVQDKIVAKEGDDHEVSMAQASLKAIITSASQLMFKLGNDERDIPGWIQDHIAKAENYIEQANQSFHELDNNDLEYEEN